MRAHAVFTCPLNAPSSAFSNLVSTGPTHHRRKGRGPRPGEDLQNFAASSLSLPQRIAFATRQQHLFVFLSLRSFQHPLGVLVFPAQPSLSPRRRPLVSRTPASVTTSPRVFLTKVAFPRPPPTASRLSATRGSWIHGEPEEQQSVTSTGTSKFARHHHTPQSFCHA